MTISRTIAIALVGLSIGFSATTSAHAGPLRDAVSEASGTALFLGAKTLDKSRKVTQEAAGTALFLGAKTLDGTRKVTQEAAGTALFVGAKTLSKLKRL